MVSSYCGRGSAVTEIFVKNWIKADGFLKPKTSVIRFSPLNTDWRMIALDDTEKESDTQKQAWFTQGGRIVILFARVLVHRCLHQSTNTTWLHLWDVLCFIQHTCSIYLSSAMLAVLLRDYRLLCLSVNLPCLSCAGDS